MASKPKDTVGLNFDVKVPVYQEIEKAIKNMKGDGYIFPTKREYYEFLINKGAKEINKLLKK